MLWRLSHGGCNSSHRIQLSGGKPDHSRIHLAIFQAQVKFSSRPRLADAERRTDAALFYPEKGSL